MIVLVIITKIINSFVWLGINNICSGVIIHNIDVPEVIMEILIIIRGIL